MHEIESEPEGIEVGHADVEPPCDILVGGEDLVRRAERWEGEGLRRLEPHHRVPHLKK